ncbi:MAG: hypothetical protein IKZ58_04925 [Selenomonadaceae bacterium]|nr:hypothetical protein [Selenomonadaceae bacterium]
MKKSFIVTAIIGAIIFLINNVACAEGNENSKEISWYYLNADDKYAKYFDPASVKVTKKATTDDGKEVPTEIQAWTKTTYSYEGAESTIKEYGITKTIPDPNSLSYSLALLKINPQTRTVQYMREDFYNPDGTVIWSTSEGRVKEINSQSFDEDFYAPIVDEVFRHGEVDRKNAKDRWIDLWSYTNDNGETIKVIADTTTMQLKGTNLIVWEWEETKNSAGQVTKIRFMKKAVNLPQGTERIAAGSMWTAAKKWTDLDDEYDGAYKSITEDDPAYKGLTRLRAYAKGYSTWVTRYSITSEAGNPTEKPKPKEEDKPVEPTPDHNAQGKTRD